MNPYLKLVKHILDNGEIKGDRTGTGTKSVFGYQMKLNMDDGFPLLTTKKVFFSSLTHELLWFIKGKTNTNDGLNSKIWDAWADDNGELGPIYGYQWRNWEQFRWDETTQSYQKNHIDQLAQAIDTIKTNPDSRRIIVNAWNVADVDKMALPPCHTFYQFYVANGRLDLQLYQRSADVALGVPFNIASYALLLHMVAAECNLKPGNFVHTFGDAHLYLNHIDGITEQLSRTPTKLPEIKIAKKPFFELTYDDIEILNYTPQDFIKFEIAV